MKIIVLVLELLLFLLVIFKFRKKIPIVNSIGNDTRLNIYKYLSSYIKSLSFLKKYIPGQSDPVEVVIFRKSSVAILAEYLELDNKLKEIHISLKDIIDEVDRKIEPFLNSSIKSYNKNIIKITNFKECIIENKSKIKLAIRNCNKMLSTLQIMRNKVVRLIIDYKKMFFVFKINSYEKDYGNPEFSNLLDSLNSLEEELLNEIDVVKTNKNILIEFRKIYNQ